MTKISQLPPSAADDNDEVPTRRASSNYRVSIPSIVAKCVSAVTSLINGKAATDHTHDIYEAKNSNIQAHIASTTVHVTSEEKTAFTNKLDRTPIVDKGSQATAVSFSLDKDSRQKVTATGTALAVNFTSLPSSFSSTSVLDIIASGNDVSITFDATIPATAWLAGDVPTSLLDGETMCISVTTLGDSKSDLVIAYAKKGV